MSFQVLRPTLTWIKSAYTYGKDPLTFCIFYYFFLFISYSVTSNLKFSPQIHYLVAKCHQIRKIVSPRCFSTINYNHLPLLWSSRDRITCSKKMKMGVLGLHLHINRKTSGESATLLRGAGNRSCCDEWSKYVSSAYRHKGWEFKCSSWSHGENRV